MKKLFFFILLLCATNMFAQSFQSGDLWYYISSTTNKTVYVKSHESHKALISVTIPSSVEYNGTTYTVTQIGSDAFSSCSSLQSVTIPNSVTSIGNDAFSSCSSLQSVTIPNSVTSIGSDAFERCSALTSVTIPNSVTSIGSYAFYYCSSLQSVTIPNSVTSIGSSAFSSCSSLRSITITANSVKEFLENNLNARLINAGNSSAERHVVVGGAELIHHVVIPEGTTTIKENAFYNCKYITSVEIPASVTSIGEKAFLGVSYVHISTNTPPSITKINIIDADGLIVLPDATTLAIYQSAPVWKELANRMVTTQGLQVREVSISAESNLSALHRSLGEENLMNTVKVKINGTINS